MKSPSKVHGNKWLGMRARFDQYLGIVIINHTNVGEKVKKFETIT
jgi:hypothetical protein